MNSMIDGAEKHDIMTCNAPNAFIQTPMEKTNRNKWVIMKIRGISVDTLLEKCLNTHGGFVVCENRKKALHVEVPRATCEMLQLASLWHQNVYGDSEECGFAFDPHDPCTATKIMNGKQSIIRFHIDDPMRSHEDPKTNDKPLKWLNNECRDHGEVTAAQGPKHNCLGVVFEFGNGEVKINMINHAKKTDHEQ